MPDQNNLRVVKMEHRLCSMQKVNQTRIETLAKKKNYLDRDEVK